MALILAAAPYEDFVRDHSPILAGVLIVILALLTIRLVYKTMTRVILLSLLGLMALFVSVERNSITECAQTCECTLAGFSTSIPFCDPDRI